MFLFILKIFESRPTPTHLDPPRPAFSPYDPPVEPTSSRRVEPLQQPRPRHLLGSAVIIHGGSELELGGLEIRDGRRVVILDQSEKVAG